MLKILLQGEFTSEEILNYLPMNPLSLQRNFRTLNEFLRDSNLPGIKKNGELFSLNLAPKEKKYLFSRIDLFSSDHRTSYLFIKIMLMGFINLEKELDFLGVSRTTINRDFEYVKEKMKNYGISIKYLHGKGSTIEGDIGSIGYPLCQEIMRMLAEKEFLPLKLKHFISEFLMEDMDAFYLEIRKISENLGINLSEFGFYFIYALDVAFYYIENFEITSASLNVKQLEKNEDFLNIKKNISNHKFINEKHHNYLSCCFYNLKNDSFYSGDFKDFCDKFFSKISEHFKLNIEIHHRLKLNIANQLYIGAFKFNNKIVSTYALKKNENDKKIMAFIATVLKDFSFSINYSEIFLLTMELKKIFIMNFLLKKLNILILLDYISNRDLISSIQAKISNISPNLNFKIESPTYYDFILKNEKKSSFDLIISYHPLDPIKGSVVKKINSLNLLNIEEILYQFFIEESLRNSQ